MSQYFNKLTNMNARSNADLTAKACSWCKIFVGTRQRSIWS